MVQSSIGRVGRWIAGVILVAASASVVPATITDDITPFVNNVRVGLHNPFTSVLTGTVVVTVVETNGETATQSAPFRLDPGASTSVTVSFAAPVSSVDNVAIVGG